MHHLRLLPGPIPDLVREEDRRVRVRDGADITVRIYTPVGNREAPHAADAKRPLIVMYHEGGWSMGDLTDEEVNCRLFSRDLGAVCVNVEYRLAPEHAFPTGVNDCWDALKWVCVRGPQEASRRRDSFISQDIIIAFSLVLLTLEGKKGHC